MQKMNVRLSTFSCRTRSTTYTSCSKLKQTISNHIFLIRWSLRWLRCWYCSFSVAEILHYWASKAESEIHWRHLIGHVYATHVLVIFMNNSRTRQLQFVFWSFCLFLVHEQLWDHDNLTKKSQTYFPSILWQKN